MNWFEWGLLVFLVCLFVIYPLYRHFHKDEWIYYGTTRYSPKRKLEQVNFPDSDGGDHWHDRFYERSCDICHGRGTTYNGDFEQVPCDHCNGTGKVQVDVLNRGSDF